MPLCVKNPVFDPVLSTVTLLLIFGFESRTLVLIDQLLIIAYLLLFMPPTLKKWGTYWLRLVRVCVCGGGGGASRYRLETSCMHSSWKNSRGIFLVFPELSPLVKLRPLQMINRIFDEKLKKII